MGRGPRQTRQARHPGPEGIRGGPEMNRFIPVTAIALVLAVAMPAMAQQKLRVADSLPVGHFFAESGTKFWMAEVKRLTGGKVDFEYFPSEQLGKAKDMLTLTQTGDRKSTRLNSSH